MTFQGLPEHLRDGAHAYGQVTVEKIQAADKGNGEEKEQILDSITDAFFAIDSDGRFIFVNRPFETIFKKEKEVLLGLELFSAFPELAETSFRSACDVFAEDRRATQFEEFLPLQQKWLSVTTYPSHSHLSVIMRDITLEKNHQQMLEESEQKFQNIADNSPMFIWTAERDFSGSFFNRACIEFAGANQDELIKNGWLSLVHPEDQYRILKVKAGIVSSKKEAEFDCRLRRHDGMYRLISFHTKPVYDDNGEVIAFLANGVDLTEISEARSTIDQQNEELQLAFRESNRLSRIINKTPHIVLLTDVSGNIAWANEAFAKIMEYSPEESFGKMPLELLQGPETSHHIQMMVMEALEKKGSLRTEIILYTKSGRKYWFDLRLEPVYLDEELTGFLMFKHDISQKKLDEIAIKERNEQISKVSFITSHELRHEFAKIVMLLNASDSATSYEELRTLMSYLKEPATLINSIISKINDNLRYDVPGIAAKEAKLSVEEICLIEDDKLTNMINVDMIRKAVPSIPLRVYESVESALEALKLTPFVKRLIFLDLNFPTSKSGWDFLEECTQLRLGQHILILSSSIDPRDIERAKKYSIVEDYICKPLTVSAFEQCAKKYCGA